MGRRAGGSIKTGLDATVSAARLKGVTPYGLRRSDAVHLVEAGVSMDEGAQRLGRSNIAVNFGSMEGSRPLTAAKPRTFWTSGRFYSPPFRFVEPLGNPLESF